MPRVKREATMGAWIKEAWARYDLRDRARLVVTMGINVPIIITKEILAAIGFKSLGRETCDSAVIEPLPHAANVWQCNYWGNCWSSIIRSADGRRLLMLTPPPTHAHTVAEVAALTSEAGDGKEDGVTLIYASKFHDSFAWKWKAKYPNAKVICSEDDMEDLRETCDIACSVESDEGRALLKEFGIDTVIDGEGYAVYSEKAFIHTITASTNGSNDDNARENIGNKIAFTGCGFGNLQPSLLNWVMGFCGLRLMRQFSMCFCKSIEAAQRHWNKIAATDGLVYVATQHGPAVYGGKGAVAGSVAKQMAAASITRQVWCSWF